MRWSLAAALLAALLMTAVACSNEPDVEVLGATATRPEIAQFASTAPPSSSSATVLVAPGISDEATDAPPAPGSRQTSIDVPTTATSATTPSPTAAQAPVAATDLAVAAEALIDYPFRSVLEDWSIEFGPARESVRGLTFPKSREIEIYVRDDDTAATVARVLAHEVGHALDLTYNDDADRDIWRSARGIEGSVPWWPDDTTFDFDTAAGDWAESFAVIQTGATHQSSVAGALSAEQVDVLLGLLP